MTCSPIFYKLVNAISRYINVYINRMCSNVAVADINNIRYTLLQ